MSLIPSPSGKAKCGEVGGKADTTPSLLDEKGLNTRGDSAGASPSLYRPNMPLPLHLACTALLHQSIHRIVEILSG